MPLDFGSVPDWVEAIGTSGALIFLAEQYRRDRKRDRDARTAEIIARADNEARHTSGGRRCVPIYGGVELQRADLPTGGRRLVSTTVR
jgi:hypothetical protein